MRSAKMPAHLRQMIHHRNVFDLKTVEKGAHLRRYVIMRAERLGQRIDELPVLFDREVEMRAGRKAARSDPSDQLSDVNDISSTQTGGNRGQMPIDTDHRVVMIDLDAAAKLP